MYSLLKKIEKPLGKIVLFIGAIGMMSVTIIIFIQVFFRYILNNSLSWTEELARYIEVWVVFVMAGYALGKGQHIYMDLLINHLPPKIKYVLEKFIAVLCLIFAVVSAKYSYVLLKSELVQKMAAFDLPKWYVYLALIVGAIIMAFYSLMLIFEGAGSTDKNEKTEEVAEA